MKQDDDFIIVPAEGYSEHVYLDDGGEKFVIDDDDSRPVRDYGRKRRPWEEDYEEEYEVTAEPEERQQRHGDNACGEEDEALYMELPRPHKLRRRLFGGDTSLWVIIISLLVLSVFVGFSALIYKEGPSATLKSQFFYMGIGIFGLWVVHLIRFQVYRNVAWWVWGIGLALTVYALFFGRGGRDLPIFGISFQPFEILKIGIVMLLAMQLAGRQKENKHIRIMPILNLEEWKENWPINKQILRYDTAPILLPIVATCGITFIAVGNSTTAIILFTCLIMLFMARVRNGDIGKVIVTLAILGMLAIAIGSIFNIGRTHTGMSRWKLYALNINTPQTKTVRALDAGGNMAEIEVYSPMVRGHDKRNRPIVESDQSVSAKMSIASGGVTGKGPGMSTHRNDLPEADKDYAYAFLIEEYGLIGGLLVLMLYLWLFFRTIEIFKNCSTAFPTMLILGLGAMITLQALLHMAVSVGLVPVFGQQLPLISKGGSSLIFTLIALGMILGVSRQTTTMMPK